jgi:hypothetical protein
MMFSTNASRFLLVLAAACNTIISAQDSPARVLLGEAGDYLILAKSGISNVAPSSINGNIGVSPIAATAITGFGLTLNIMDLNNQFSMSSQLVAPSCAYAASYGGQTATTLTAAVGAMGLAYTDAAGRPGVTAKTNLAGGHIGTIEGAKENPFTAGVYTFGVDIIIDADLYFSGNSDSVFIIRTAGALKQLAGTKVILGDVNPENIFWQMAGNLVVEEGAEMAGILLVKTDALFKTGSSLKGRVLAQTACNLQEVHISV